MTVRRLTFSLPCNRYAGRGVHLSERPWLEQARMFVALSVALSERSEAIAVRIALLQHYYLRCATLTFPTHAHLLLA